MLPNWPAQKDGSQAEPLLHLVQNLQAADASLSMFLMHCIVRLLLQ